MGEIRQLETLGRKIGQWVGILGTTADDSDRAASSEAAGGRTFLWRPSGRTSQDVSQAIQCLFCRRADPAANTVILENRFAFVRLDNFPATPGHVEVVPKRHVVSFFELCPDEVATIYDLACQAKEELANRYAPDGFTIGVNEGRAAGRSIDHLHLHVIPRHDGDVPDPRGGIRQVVPNCDPDAWAQPTAAVAGL